MLSTDEEQFVYNGVRCTTSQVHYYTRWASAKSQMIGSITSEKDSATPLMVSSSRDIPLPVGSVGLLTLLA